MRQKLVPTLFLLIAVTAVVGCSKESRLLGKWTSVGDDKPWSVECLSDHTAIVTADNFTASGTCSILDDGRVKIAFTAFGTTAALLGTFADNDLVLDIDGKPTRLIKASGS